MLVVGAGVKKQVGKGGKHCAFTTRLSVSEKILCKFIATFMIF